MNVIIGLSIMAAALVLTGHVKSLPGAVGCMILAGLGAGVLMYC